MNAHPNQTKLGAVLREPLSDRRLTRDNLAAEFRCLAEFSDCSASAPVRSGRILGGGRWSLQFENDPAHRKVWRVLRRRAYLCNNRSLNGKAAVKFSARTTVRENRGPAEQLAWRIECCGPRYRPDTHSSTMRFNVPRGIPA